MKKSHFFIIAGISLLLSVLGFALDINERIDSVFLNVFEIFMMFFVCFGMISTLYVGFYCLRKGWNVL